MSIKKVYLGIDNGVSGSIGIITPTEISNHKTPVFTQQDYVKKKANITRVDTIELLRILKEAIGDYKTEEVVIGIERPMVNPQRFVATKSALRALEATLVTIEQLGLPYQFLDSKEWQKVMLPKGATGEELKTVSLDIGKRLFPHLDTKGLKDFDGILIAEYLRKTN